LFGRDRNVGRCSNYYRVMGNQDAAYVNALEVAKAQLADVEHRYRQLHLERQRLQNVIGTLSTILGIEETPNSVTENSEATFQHPKAQPAWAWIKAVLHDEGKPLSATEIYNILLQKGIGTISKDAVRVSLTRKSDIFRSDGTGLYSIALPTEFEASDGNPQQLNPFSEVAG